MKAIAVYKKLYSQLGQQLWWPVTGPGHIKPSYRKRKTLSEKQRFEICAGAILTQNTDWGNAMKALENLGRAKMLSCKAIAGSSRERIASLVRPSGYFNQKAKKLLLFSKYLKKNYGCRVSKMFNKPVEELREELLQLHGIGNETADDIILYAAQKPVFVVDAYTKRFVQRFFGQNKTDYVEVKAFFESQLPKDQQLFSEFHALLVEFGKRYCNKKPVCSDCFLRRHCLYGRNT